VFFRRKVAGAHVVGVRFDGLSYLAAYVGVLLDERRGVVRHPDYVIEYENLTVDAAPCTYSDRRHADFVGDAGTETPRHGLEYDGENACFFELARALDDGVGLVFFASEDAVTLAPHLLGGQTDVSHDWHAEFGQAADRLDAHAAFDGGL
jgi:hypothetical protein